MSQTVAQQAYEVWIASLYSNTTTAYGKGVKTWQQLPERAQKAWEVTVEFVRQGALTKYLKETSEIQ
jgi:hypothetical protein